MITLSVFILGFSGCAASEKVLTKKDNGKDLNLKVNDTVEIKLESNPTTGYSWFLGRLEDNSIVSISGPEFIDSKKDKELVGSGGYETFVIKALSRGTTSIILNYKKLWEKDVDPIETFEITVFIE
jgi:inhibitor of cysteine peptidase